MLPYFQYFIFILDALALTTQMYSLSSPSLSIGGIKTKAKAEAVMFIMPGM